MADIREWVKGISFFIFVTLLFYFLWTNIFSSIIEFVGSDVFGLVGTTMSGELVTNTSIQILKAMCWVSFVILYLSIGSIYLIYSFIAGAKGEIETHPIEFLKAIGCWAITMPFLTFIYGLMMFLEDTLSSATAEFIDAGGQTIASGFSWILALIVLIILIILPFYYVLKGYGMNIFGKQEGGKTEG